MSVPISYDFVYTDNSVVTQRYAFTSADVSKSLNDAVSSLKLPSSEVDSNAANMYSKNSVDHVETFTPSNHVYVYLYSKNKRDVQSMVESLLKNGQVVHYGDIYNEMDGLKSLNSSVSSSKTTSSSPEAPVVNDQSRLTNAPWWKYTH